MKTVETDSAQLQSFYLSFLDEGVAIVQVEFWSFVTSSLQPDLGVSQQVSMWAQVVYLVSLCNQTKKVERAWFFRLFYHFSGLCKTSKPQIRLDALLLKTSNQIGRLYF